MPQPRAARPSELVVLTRADLQEAVDELVERGRITRGDAADLVADLLARRRGRADELRVDGAPLEQVGRRGPEPPIARYDDLTAAEVAAELDGISDADLRAVREYEKANANRKTVLGTIERRLG